MALLSHSGLGTSDINVGATRIDISDFLPASLLPENNILGNIKVGAEWNGQTLNYVEDKVNPNLVTSLNSLNNSDDPGTLTLSAADAAVLDVGYILADTAAGGIILGEQLMVTAIAPGSPFSTVTVSRSYGGTPIQTHAGGATLKVVGTPTYQNSDLGRDLSRARLVKTNFRQSVEINVNIAQEVIEIARGGYAPGVDDELYYQFCQRVTEKLRDVNASLVYGRPSNVSPSSANLNDYSTAAGMVSFLDGTFNPTATPVDFGGAALTMDVINTINANITRQGATPDWLVCGLNGVQTISNIYGDRVRIEQSDDTRGFKVKFIDTFAENSLRVMYDQTVYDTAPDGMLIVMDSGRWSLRPFSNSLFYVITSESFRDGDAVRAMMKWSVQANNTGTDAGFASQLATGLTMG